MSTGRVPGPLRVSLQIILCRKPIGTASGVYSPGQLLQPAFGSALLANSDSTIASVSVPTFTLACAVPAQPVGLTDRIWWGVDSSNTADHKVGKKMSLFEYISEKAGQPPAFWGRYIGGNGKLAAPLTSSEAAFLHSKGCKILVLYNGATNSATSVRGGYKEGQKDANNAIAAAVAIGVPAGVWIYGDTETNWQVTVEWFKGWSDTMYASGYGGAGGIYGNCMPTNASGFNTPYLKACKEDDIMRMDGQALIFGSHPEITHSTTAKNAPKYGPAAPEGLKSRVVIWQYVEGVFNGFVDEDLATELGFQSMW